MLKYRIRLKAAHDATGKSPYEVAADLRMSNNTVRKYAENEEVLQDQITIGIAILAKYYGVPYSSVVDVVEVDDDTEGQTKTLLAIPA
jgi:hypothetical protein